MIEKTQEGIDSSNRGLSESQRKAIHDLALAARKLLTQEAREQLEGVYGVHGDGTFEEPKALPALTDPEKRATYDQLRGFMEDEYSAGMSEDEAVDKLVKEVAFTHLNRLVAFKMMEVRKLIRETVSRGPDSNGFKFYLAEHQDEEKLWRAGNEDIAYRNFLLWQAAQISEEVRMLFDPEDLVSRLFPRPQALDALLDMLNALELADIWRAEETIGWIYQYFNEQEKGDVFDRLYKQKKKFRPQDIPAATQLFTPNWIVRFLVQNALGRLWVQMHPDTWLDGTPLLDYLVPLKGEVSSEPLRLVKEITLLDPACGGMHFGLVAFDLFAAMYQEELERAGEPGWPKTPSVSDPAEISAAIIQHNLFGIDIDLRAVQLSALALYLKAKALSPQAHITDSNLACADVLPLDGDRLGTFLGEARFTRPIYERLIRALWDRLQDVSQLGSLLRLERDIGDLISEERARYEKAPLFAGVSGEFEREAAEEEFWDVISAQIVQGLDEFARQQAHAGADQSFFVGEATKGLRLLDLMLRRYDVVVANPPYSNRGNLNDALVTYLDDEYSDAKSDLYAAFIQRCSEFLTKGGRLGMITQQSFMFLPSFAKLRSNLRDVFAIETIAHTGPRAFAEISGEKVNTTIFALRGELDTPIRENNVGTYFRLVNAPEGDGKRRAFEQALGDGSHVYQIAQRRFDAIHTAPWVYALSDEFLRLFEQGPKLSDLGRVELGISSVDMERFYRYVWEIDLNDRWYFLEKGGAYVKWYGIHEWAVNWEQDGEEFKEEIIHRYPYLNGNYGLKVRNEEWLKRPGLTYSRKGGKRFSARILMGGNIIEDNGPGIFFDDIPELAGLAVLNSSVVNFVLNLTSAGIDYQKGELERLPFPRAAITDTLARCAIDCCYLTKKRETYAETVTDFVAPMPWATAQDELVASYDHLTMAERLINEEVFRIYSISDEDRVAIEVELGGVSQGEDDGEDGATLTGKKEEEEPVVLITREELAVRWISYAVGIVMGRFQPGDPDGPGSAVYRRDDFGVGSLPVPDENQLDQLVGPPERFAYVDGKGARHVFAAGTEQALRDLATPDGISVLDEERARDLPKLVDHALALMLGREEAQKVLDAGAGGDLRRFLQKSFFTQHHIKQYRKRPVYWPIQSRDLSYGFVIFHEKVGQDTFYILQRDYLDIKRKQVALQLEETRARLEGAQGRERKKIEAERVEQHELADELEQFAKDLEDITQGGYQPASDWIDDGVILRMAPLWKVIPVWQKEPRKYWDRLSSGDYDWSHIAMHYWPERAREKCRANKSYAIAHGLEGLCEGQ